MSLFFKPSATGENRIENAGRWPIRLTHFHLSDEYSFPATNYPEIFYIQKGGLLHETKNGKQTIREGFAILVHPGHQHTISNPENVVISRIRYLPEWFSMEVGAIVEMPDVLSLFFDQSWLQFPREDSLHVFNTRDRTRRILDSELPYLQDMLGSGNNLTPCSRLSLLKIMEAMADDFQRYWRGAGGPKMTPAVRFAFNSIERKIFAGEPFREPTLLSSEFDKAEVESDFREFSGLSPREYSERRRIFHAAYYLISTEDDPKHISKITGFVDMTKFEQAFDETFEISPGVYREKFKALGPEETF